MKLLARRALAFLAWSPLLLMATDCGNQGEGERCNKELHNHVDCNAGLICKKVYVQGWHDICCPVPPARVNIAACNAAGIPPSDGGPTTPDARPDTRTDGGADRSAPDVNGDAVDEATDDRSTIDISIDVSSDMGTDASLPDTSTDGTAADASNDLPSIPDQTSGDGADDTPVDAPPLDTAPDAPADVASELPPDGPPLDDVTPIDVGDAADAPAESGPG